MGNSSGKESSPDSAYPTNRRRSSNASTNFGLSGSAAAAAASSGSATSSDHNPALSSHSAGRRAGAPDFSFLGLSGGGGSSDRDAATEARKETRAEKEARKLEKERAARVKERERSIKKEHVDGGFLVTMGTYTASEDFSKAIVRQMIIERRIAPFWRGLNDFSSSWTEHQIVAAARDLPIPAPDEIPAEFSAKSSQSSLENIKSLSPESSALAASSPKSSLPTNTTNINDSGNNATNDSSIYISSRPTFSSPPQPSSVSPATTSPLFRGRSKTLASLTTFRNNSYVDMIPQEYELPKDPFVNGQRIEVFLYKNATECPICFLYFPPYFNKSRCCDQPICSECFVQIKRPEPHQPENLNPGEENRSSAEDAMLVSEPAQCPFCTEPEFGVTYDPPPFRRGLTYVNQTNINNGNSNKNAITSLKSATSSSSSIASHQGPGSQSAAAGVGRRRAVSLSANASNVITTDRIRPDWATKLADARAQAMRRSAAATALHNAAYLLNGGTGESRGFMLGRRRRTNLAAEGFGGSSGGDRGNPRVPDGMTPEGMIALLSGAANRRTGGSGDGRVGNDGNDDLFPGRTSSRRTRVEELEEMMMMEAIRQSLQAEEDRKRKEDKEASKAAKKEDKKRAKEAKKAEKAAKKRGDGSSGGNKLYKSSTASSSSTIPYRAGTNKSISSSTYQGIGGDNSLRLDGAVMSYDNLTTTGSEVPGTEEPVVSGRKGKEPDRTGLSSKAISSTIPNAANVEKIIYGKSQMQSGPSEGPSATKSTATQKKHNKGIPAASSSSSISSSTLTSSGSSSSTTRSSSPLRSRSRSRSTSGAADTQTAPSSTSMASRPTIKMVQSSTSTLNRTVDQDNVTGKESGGNGNGGNIDPSSSSNSKDQSTDLPLTGFRSLAGMVEAGMQAQTTSSSSSSSTATAAAAASSGRRQ